MIRRKNTGLRGFLMNWERPRELGKQAHEARQGTRAQLMDGGKWEGGMGSCGGKLERRERLELGKTEAETG